MAYNRIKGIIIQKAFTLNDIGLNNEIMFKNVKKIIGPYKKPKAVFHPYDHRVTEVARYLKNQIELYMPEVLVEHIGSTAIPGCPGKGVVDLMALYPANQLDTIVALLCSLGFQRQGKEFRNRFPDERPVMMGTYKHAGTSFLVYVHVIHEDSYEPVRFRIFRDRLLGDAEMLSDYIEEKKRIIRSGVTDTDDYAELKRPIIERILGDEYNDYRQS